MYGCTDDPQCLHFHVVLRRGEQALQRLPHAELFEILRTDANFSHWRPGPGPGPVVEGVSKSDKADERQQHTCVTIRIVDVLDELGTAVMKKRNMAIEGRPYHFEIVQRRQTRIVVEGRILRLCEGLLHQLRVGPAEDRVDDARIEVRPPREGHGAGRRVGVVVGVAGIFDAPTEKFSIAGELS